MRFRTATSSSRRYRLLNIVLLLDGSRALDLRDVLEREFVVAARAIGGTADVDPAAERAAPSTRPSRWGDPGRGARASSASARLDTLNNAQPFSPVDVGPAARARSSASWSTMPRARRPSSSTRPPPRRLPGERGNRRRVVALARETLLLFRDWDFDDQPVAKRAAPAPASLAATDGTPGRVAPPSAAGRRAPQPAAPAASAPRRASARVPTRQPPGPAPASPSGAASAWRSSCQPS